MFTDGLFFALLIIQIKSIYLLKTNVGLSSSKLYLKLIGDWKGPNPRVIVNIMLALFRVAVNPFVERGNARINAGITWSTAPNTPAHYSAEIFEAVIAAHHWTT